MKKPCTMHHTHDNTIPTKTPYPQKHHTHDDTRNYFRCKVDEETTPDVGANKGTTSDVEVDENENEETTPDAEQTKELLQM